MKPPLVSPAPPVLRLTISADNGKRILIKFRTRSIESVTPVALEVAAMAGDATFHIRPARDTEAATLSEIAFESKGHWGYPADWMERWRASLEITPMYVRANPVFVAQLDPDLAGFVAALQCDGFWDLDHLWLRPAFMGQGIGRRLFEHVVAHLREQAGPGVLRVESEPNAEGFYLRLGARRIGTIERDWAGLRRELPHLELDLGPRP